jgi:hypothetical protein
MERRSGEKRGRRGTFARLGPPLAEKLMDTGNLVLGGLVVAQFFGAGAFDSRLALVGLALWVLLFGAAAWLLYAAKGAS